MVVRRSAPRKRRQQVSPAVAAVMIVVAAAIICSVFYMIFFRKPLTSAEGVNAMQQAINAGQVLNTPPEKLRSLGISLPAGYEQKAVERKARLDAEAHAKAAAEKAGNGFDFNAASAV